MATFVLVPGAYSGAWYLKEEAALLEAAGHKVHRCTLTGLGERSHLASPAVDLDTHIMDVVNVLRYEDLTDVILMGHSYGGMVISGVAEQVPERIAQLVYLDAIVPTDGAALYDTNNDADMKRLQERLAGGSGWQIPVDWEHGSKDWRRFPHPAGTFTQAISLKSQVAAAIPKTYVLCTADKEHGSQSMMLAMAKRAQAEGWRYFEIDATHGVLRERPELVADILLSLA